jgi:type I restriction enzyme S subunit
MTFDLAVEAVSRTLPSGWRLEPFRRHAMLVDEANTDHSMPLLSLASTGVIAPRIEDGGLGKQAPSESTIGRYWIARPGNLVVNPMWLTGGGIGVSKVTGAVSPDYRVYRLGSDLHPPFVHHLLRSSPYRDQYRLYTRADTTFDRRVSKENFHPMPLLIPPLDEQHRIADFLSFELSKLEDLVAKKHQLLDILNERIDSRILRSVGQSRIVTPGGSPVLPIRRLLTKVTRPALSGFGVITAYRDGQVTTRDARRTEGYTLSASEDPQGYFVRAGDVIVHGLDGFAGAIGTSEAQGNCSPVYHVCTQKPGSNAQFLGRMLRVLAVQGYLGGFAISTRERAVDFRNWDLFGRIPVPVVPQAEQEEVGHWINQLRPMRRAIERSTALATERRQALITAAVTGQFDVSTASGRNVTEGVSV